MTESMENRRRRWIIFSVLALIYILVYFYRVSLAVVAGDITRDLKLTPQQLGGLSGVLFYVYGVAQLPLGPMIDRIGSRKVISGCGVLTAIGGILFSQAESLSVAMTARILIGIGTASVLMATLAIFSHWFSKQEFGRVSGFMVAVGNIGNLAATAPLALAVAAIGWRQSFLIIGIFQIAVTALVFLMVRDRPNRDTECEHHEPFSEKPPGMIAAWGEIFGKADFWLLGLIAFAWYGNYLALQGLWGGPYLMEALHLSREETGKLLMFTSIGFIAGSMVIDSVARKLFRSYKRTLLAGQLLLLILMSVFIGPAAQLPQILFIPLFFLIGLAVSSGVMIYPVIRVMFPVRIVGTALTSLNFFVLMGAAVTQQLMGIIIGKYGKNAGLIPPEAFHAAFLLPVATLAVAVVMFAFAKDYSLGGSGE
jgi:sugar phosphate permease